MVWWSTKDARIYVEQQGVPVSLPTFMKWVHEGDFAHQLYGRRSRWLINPQKFRNFIAGKKRIDRGVHDAPNS